MGSVRGLKVCLWRSFWDLVTKIKDDQRSNPQIFIKICVFFSDLFGDTFGRCLWIPIAVKKNDCISLKALANDQMKCWKKAMRAMLFNPFLRFWGNDFDNYTTHETTRKATKNIIQSCFFGHLFMIYSTSFSHHSRFWTACRLRPNPPARVVSLMFHHKSLVTTKLRMESSSRPPAVPQLPRCNITGTASRVKAVIAMDLCLTKKALSWKICCYWWVSCFKKMCMQIRSVYINIQNIIYHIAYYRLLCIYIYTCKCVHYMYYILYIHM